MPLVINLNSSPKAHRTAVRKLLMAAGIAVGDELTWEIPTTHPAFQSIAHLGLIKSDQEIAEAQQAAKDRKHAKKRSRRRKEAIEDLYEAKEYLQGNRAQRKSKAATIAGLVDNAARVLGRQQAERILDRLNPEGDLVAAKEGP